jgi:predicted GIY-YIG superfamily endonuclease
MTSTAKTIQIFLPSGDPRGLRIAEITTRIVQVIEVPRTRLDEFMKMPESAQVAIYFLCGTSDSGDGDQVYIGQTGDVRARLASHNSKKGFWQRAFVLVSRTNSLTQTHALFLEWHCLKLAAEAARYNVDNANAGSKPHTPAPLEADCLEIFETGRILLSTLGFPLFDALASGANATTSETYFCQASGANARGLFTDEGFIVLKGSIGREQNAISIKGTRYERFRTTLLEMGVMQIDGDKVIFEKDHLFGSPSMAAVAVLGQTANGWTTWKLKDGRTLDQVKRRGVDA